MHRFPFAVVYRELPSVIQVLAVAHGHRRPGYWKTRIEPDLTIMTDFV
jgi:hypothetical protein